MPDWEDRERTLMPKLIVSCVQRTGSRMAKCEGDFIGE
jgi:hypothetical protein